MSKYIACCSGGKDSVATLILAKRHNEPLHEVMWSEVMFDEETSGEMPEHKEFITTKLKPFVENELGVPFVMLKSEKTYVDFFTHIISKGPNVGKPAGYPIPGMCAINRDCKTPPMKKYVKEQGADSIQYIGIAADETERLARLDSKKQISLLAKYGITEAEAFELCKEAGLLSPIYEFSKRNGCWFCFNCKDAEWQRLIFKHGHLFDKLIRLEEKHPIRARNYLTYGETASQIKERIIRNGEQLTMF